MSTQCEGCRDLIGPHLDGELSGRERDQLEAHFATCAECTRALEVLRVTERLVVQHAPEADPGKEYGEALARRVARRVAALPAPGAVERQSAVKRYLSSWTVRAVGGLALATAVFVLALRIGFQAGDDAPTMARDKSLLESPPTVSLSERPQRRPEASGGGDPAVGEGRVVPPTRAAPHSAESAGRMETVPRPEVPAPGQDTILAGNMPQASLAGAPPDVAEASGSGAKPARGGIGQMAALHAQWEQEATRALSIPPEAEADSVARKLREREVQLRDELAATDAATKLVATGRSGADVRRGLAEVLYRLAMRTKDRRDANRALLFWRPNYEGLAHAFGDSTAQARMSHLERLILGEADTAPSR